MKLKALTYIALIIIGGLTVLSYPIVRASIELIKPLIILFLQILINITKLI